MGRKIIHGFGIFILGLSFQASAWGNGRMVNINDPRNPQEYLRNDGDYFIVKKGEDRFFRYEKDGNRYYQRQYKGKDALKRAQGGSQPNNAVSSRPLSELQSDAFPQGRGSVVTSNGIQSFVREPSGFLFLVKPNGWKGLIADRESMRRFDQETQKATASNNSGGEQSTKRVEPKASAQNSQNQSQDSGNSQQVDLTEDDSANTPDETQNDSGAGSEEFASVTYQDELKNYNDSKAQYKKDKAALAEDQKKYNEMVKKNEEGIWESREGRVETAQDNLDQARKEARKQYGDDLWSTYDENETPRKGEITREDLLLTKYVQADGTTTTDPSKADTYEAKRARILTGSDDLIAIKKTENLSMEEAANRLEQRLESTPPATVTSAQNELDQAVAAAKRTPENQAEVQRDAKNQTDHQLRENSHSGNEPALGNDDEVLSAAHLEEREDKLADQGDTLQKSQEEMVQKTSERRQELNEERHSYSREKEFASNSDPCSYASSINSSYSCSGTRSMTKYAPIVSQVVQAGGQAAVQAAGANAQAKARRSGTQTDALKEAARTAKASATAQLSSGALQGAMAVVLASGAYQASSNAKAIQANVQEVTATKKDFHTEVLMGGREVVTGVNFANGNQDQRSVLSKLQYVGNNKSLASAASSVNGEIISVKNRATSELRTTSEEAKMLAIVTGIQGAAALTQGGFSMNAALEMEKAAKRIKRAEDATAAAVDFSSDPFNENAEATAPRTGFNFSGNSNGPVLSAAEEDEDLGEDPGGDLGIGDGLDSFNEDFVANAPTGGAFDPNAGGAGGGAGGGAPSLGGGGTSAASGDDPSQSAAKYADLGGGGGPDYLSDGAKPQAGGARAGGAGSGGPDLSGLLAQFLPKEKEDDAAQNGVLDFSGGEGGREVASREPTSLLGKQANLFSNITERYRTKTKRGDVGI